LRTPARDEPIISHLCLLSQRKTPTTPEVARNISLRDQREDADETGGPIDDHLFPLIGPLGMDSL